MSKTLDDEKKIEVAEIVRHGERITLPSDMSLDAAVKTLQRRMKYEEEKMDMSQTFEAYPFDGAYAVHQVLTRKFGWATSEVIIQQGFFGPTEQRPMLLSVPVGPDKTVQVPWGAFSIPGLEGMLCCEVHRGRTGLRFKLEGTIKRKHERMVQDLFDEIAAYLKENSIYRGQALRVLFTDGAGDRMGMPEITPLDTRRIDPASLIYSDDVMNAVQTSLFTPIQRVPDLADNGIPVKRGILLAGPFGTGKTMAAHVASKLAVDNGLTFLYVQKTSDLPHAIEFAKLYQSPACVIFCEDIDRSVSGERSVEMDEILNIIDGIDTKDANIITVLTTNALEDINPAMLRPGRLDAVIDVTPPDAGAVERLIRHYGSDAIDAKADLSEPAKVLAGQIPATVAEVVKRAKLSQLRLQSPGEKVTSIGKDALLEAAKTMNYQLEALRRATEPKAPEPEVELALGKVFRKAMNGTSEKLDDIRKRIEDVYDEV